MASIASALIIVNTRDVTPPVTFKIVRKELILSPEAPLKFHRRNQRLDQAGKLHVIFPQWQEVFIEPARELIINRGSHPRLR